MPRPTNASLLDRIKDLERLTRDQTKAIADTHGLADHAHERLDKAGQCFVAMRDDVGGQLAAMGEQINCGSFADAQA